MTLRLDKNASSPRRRQRHDQGLGSPVFNEVPSGTINGSNATFTLARTPKYGTVQVFVDGIATDDFSIVGRTLTVTTPPNTALLVHYWE